MTDGVEEFVPDDGALHSEIGAREPVAHVIARASSLPLLELDNRQFEILTFLLLRERAGTFYDQVSLLRTGADKARDILLRRGTVTGIVQCKRKANRIGRDELLIEILRLALYAVRDPMIAPASGTRYQLWTASGITEQARRFIDAPDAAAVMRSEMPRLFARARKQLVSLAPYSDAVRDKAEQAAAIELATRLIFDHVGPEEIASEVNRRPGLRRQFFRSPDDGPVSASITEINDLARQWREEQLARLKAAGRIGSNPYVARSGLDQTFGEFLLAPGRTFAVIGGSGQGKTSWVARLLASPPAGHAMVVIPADRIAPSDRTPVDTIANLLTARPLDGIATDRFDQAVWTWLESGNYLLAVDGLDRVTSEVRETLPAWLEAALDLTRKTPVRLVLTARREAWSALCEQVPSLADISVRPEEQDAKVASFKLAALDPDEAETVYSAYGVAPDQHRGARLTTPSLIALFSRLRSTAGAIVTRFDILESESQALETELRRAGIGKVTVRQTLDWIGGRLLATDDGWIPIGAPAQLTPALDAMIDRDRLVGRDGLVRMESDDLAELLLARRLTPERIVEALDKGRKDAIFIGAAALVIARCELGGTADQALGTLLDGATPGRSARLDVIARAALELREPALVTHRLVQAIGLWEDENLFLLLNNLGTMIMEIDLPGRVRFDLLKPLIDGEDAEDWRDKYWRGNQAGRLFSPFGVAAERAVAEDPTGFVPDLIDLVGEHARTRSSIGRTLLFRAAEAAPESVLSITWARHRDVPEAFLIAAIAAPIAAARFLPQIELTDRHVARFVVERLWAIAGREDDTELVSGDLVTAVRDAADAFLARIDRPALRARLLVIRLGAEPMPELSAELDELWPSVPDALFWDAVVALGPQGLPRVLDLLEGAAKGRDIDRLLSTLSGQALNSLDSHALLAGLRRFVERSPDHVGPVAEGLELMLYAFPAPAMPALESFAILLAESPDDKARAKLIYYAGSLVRGDPAPDEIARRARILDKLIAHETGGNVDQLVWKIIESAPQRPAARRQLELLAERVGTDLVRKAIEKYDFLPGAKDVGTDFDCAAATSGASSL
ncbi:MAG: hypothetical protein JWL86_6343 [Rhizobium sp.]|nr:hypothetical protein [Rhizobium sp.]